MRIGETTSSATNVEEDNLNQVITQEKYREMYNSDPYFHRSIDVLLMDFSTKSIVEILYILCETRKSLSDQLVEQMKTRKGDILI